MTKVRINHSYVKGKCDLSISTNGFQFSTYTALTENDLKLIIRTCRQWLNDKDRKEHDKYTIENEIKSYI